ncbi:hypothetical protein P7228_05625 [Altererythrobacter arenosus]|uniref:Uncharacterized protein n=1 Tax=Altererythrobacter arenosus TaxID=3032592 RepID=A0ABY8G1N7_9SPHN|nr:hypothetical protein [Altererythrobacter sp. CAU 1644]WFL78544.1 hypothetical protein P7228_05625 [Altererythrobacter sp. CAU 1644]
MGLFKPDLYRNFAIGFLVGALAVGATSAQDWSAELASPAHATTAEADRAAE